MKPEMRIGDLVKPEGGGHYAYDGKFLRAEYGVGSCWSSQEEWTGRLAHIENGYAVVQARVLAYWVPIDLLELAPGQMESMAA